MRRNNKRFTIEVVDVLLLNGEKTSLFLEGDTIDYFTFSKAFLDMLRYEDGSIVEARITDSEVRAIVNCHTYTPDRWKSFGIKTRIVDISYTLRK